MVAAAAIHLRRAAATVVALRRPGIRAGAPLGRTTGTSSKRPRGRSPHTGCPRSAGISGWSRCPPSSWPIGCGTIPLFDFVSVDELFRIAGAGRQVRHEGGRELYHEGAQAEESSSCSRARCACLRSSHAVRVAAPAALAFEKMLEGSPLRLRARGRSDDLPGTLGSDEFLTMLSDNILLAQGLFRMLLNMPKAQHWRIVYTPTQHPSQSSPRSLPLQPLEKVLLIACRIPCSSAQR